MRYEIDLGDHLKVVTKRKLHRYFRTNVTDWACFEDWFFDCKWAGLIKGVR